MFNLINNKRTILLKSIITKIASISIMTTNITTIKQKIKYQIFMCKISRLQLNMQNKQLLIKILKTILVNQKKATSKKHKIIHNITNKKKLRSKMKIKNIRMSIQMKSKLMLKIIIFTKVTLQLTIKLLSLIIKKNIISKSSLLQKTNTKKSITKQIKLIKIRKLMLKLPTN